MISNNIYYIIIYDVYNMMRYLVQVGHCTICLHELYYVTYIGYIKSNTISIMKNVYMSYICV